MTATRHNEFGPFEVDISPGREAVRVSPLGEIDLATAGRLRERVRDLRAAGWSRVILDLDGVTFMDSTGIRLVIELVRSSQEDHWELAVTRVPPAVHRVFELSGVLGALPLGDGETA